jgi:hypothetical protein
VHQNCKNHQRHNYQQHRKPPLWRLDDSQQDCNRHAEPDQSQTDPDPTRQESMLPVHPHHLAEPDPLGPLSNRPPQS